MTRRSGGIGLTKSMRVHAAFGIGPGLHPFGPCIGGGWVKDKRRQQGQNDDPRRHSCRTGLELSQIVQDVRIASFEPTKFSLAG